jgi:CheY-like chemotaxis protein/anti-sigma regulatory factor (Ser/Thr protein kinase)
VKVRPHPCSPVEMVEDAAAMMRPRALERGLELTMSYQGELPRTVATDPLRLRQVLVNLMSNAIKFTDRGTVGIEVRMESADGGLPARLVIAVTDTGIGIPPHRLASLFQPFMRAHAEEQPHRSGTGLGLSIAQRLILLLGGQIAVASRPGEGSTFTVSLPLTAGEAGDAATGEVLLADLQRGRGDAPGPVTLHGLRTLLVDDNPHNERIIRYILQRAGALVSSVTDGLAGVEAVLGAQADGRPFDVILMDMRMPRMDGYTAVRLLRGEEVRTPIIALTAQAVGEDDRRCLASGCDAYVAKPIDEAALLQTVSRLARCEAVADGPSAPSMTGGRGTNLAHDAGFAAAAMRYAAGLNDSAEQLRSAWMVRDHRVLLEVTHRLRGTATNYGFPEITRAAGECEILLRAPADEPILRTAIDRLIDALQKAAPPVRMSS